MKKSTFIPLAAAILALFSSPQTHASNATWSGTTDGTWSTATNWSGGVAPVNGDNVIFTGGSNLNTTNDLTGLSLSTGAPGEYSLRIQSTPAVTIGGNQLTIGSGNAGEIALFGGNHTISADLNLADISVLVRYDGTQTLSGVMSGTRGAGGPDEINFWGNSDTSRIVVTGNSTYNPFNTIIYRGIVQVNSLGNGNQSGSLGKSPYIRASALTWNAAIDYVGAGDSTDRQIRFGETTGAGDTGGFSLLNNGSGALVFTAPTLNNYLPGQNVLGNRTFTLGGNNTDNNEIQSIITNNKATGNGTGFSDTAGTIGITKSGTGKWILSGNNTYTGLTTVENGTLVVSHSTFVATILPGSTTVNFASVPSPGTHEVLPGPLAAASLAGKTVSGLGFGQTATLTNAPNLKVTVSAPVNQKPVISPGQSFTIAENSAAGTVVGVLSAIDVDSQAVSLSGWSILSGNIGNAFSLNWSTGELTLLGSLNYEATPIYNLTVTVSDGKDTSEPVNVTITVANVAEFSDVFGSADPMADSNGDGIPNRLAYALGATDSNSTVAVPSLALTSTNLMLTALVRINDPRGQLLGNTATDLTNWPTNPSIVGIPTADQTGAVPGVTQRQVFSVERGSDTRKFLRLVAPASMAQDTPVQNTASIQAQIDAAVAAGRQQVRIQPGVYTNIVPTGINPHVRLASLSNLDIDATGVVLVCSRLSRAIFIRDCTNLTLRGLTIDYSPLPMTQGTITGFGPSREWTDVRIHAGYPAPAALTNGWSFLWTSDAQTRRIKAGTANRPNQSITDMGGGVWRVAHGMSFYDQAAVGDYLRIPQPVVDNTALVANRCSNLTLINVTIYSAPFHFASSFGWDNGLTIQSCRIVPGPTPAGATEPRLFSSVGDGFNFEGITGGLNILDCEADSTGDDGIAVYDMPLLVGAVADGGKTVTMSFAAPGGTDSRWVKRPKAGTRFRFYVAATGAIEEGLVTSQTSSTMSSQDWMTLRNQLMPGVPATVFTEPFVVQLQAAVSASPGDEARMLDDPFETIIRGCRVRNSGSRGIVANAPRIRIENNQIEDTLLPAVHTYAFFSDGGPGFQEDVSITGNWIARANLHRSLPSDFLGSICVVNWDTNRSNFGGHRRVTIENNDIAESWGVDVQVHAATNVIVRGNRFVDSHWFSVGKGTPRPVDNTAAIFLQDIQGAVIETNQIIRPGPYLGIQPLSTQGVTDLQAGQPFIP